MVNRRTFIKWTGLGALGTLAAPGLILSSCKKDREVIKSSIRVSEGAFDFPLPGLPKADARSASLVAKSNSAMLLNGKKTSVLGYADGILGPTLECKQGDQLNVSFLNSLKQESNVHWHGLIVPENMDGGPNASVKPNSGFNYTFPIIQRASAYWYHPHPHGFTGEQVHRGLGGLLIVRDEEEAALNLPSGNNELQLVLQDKRLHPDYSINYSPNSDEVMTGYFGQFVMVNGAWSPVKEIQSSWYRLRVLNASNARLYNLAFSNLQTFYVIGSDGGLLESPEPVQNLLLAPGERADILVDFSSINNGQEVFLINQLFSGGVQGRQEFTIMKFRVVEKVADDFILPPVLSVIQRINYSTSSTVRTFELGHAGGSHGGHAGHGGGDMSGMHSINGLIYDPGRIDVNVKSGDIEIWEFDNSKSSEIHPMHIHGLQFNVIERIGGRGVVIPSEKGYKDTVLLMPREKVRIALTFPDYKGVYMIHCHNLEHEDDGMMLNYQIS
jgi:blue copper oxidase